MITYTYKVSMTPGGIPVRCKLGQYDDDWTIVFTLYSAYGTFSIESGTTAKIRGTKRDGLGYSANATINISAGTVTVAGDKQITAVAGDNLFELVLLKGTKELSTANIIFSVEPAAMDAGTLVSDSQVQEILDMSADVIAASANVSTLRGNFAPAYSSSSTYSVGDYAMYNNQLYRCTTAISTAEAWTAGHWTAVALGDDVSDLKSDITEETVNICNASIGRYQSGDGDIVPSNNNYCGLNGKIAIEPDALYICKIYQIDFYRGYVSYYDQDGAFLLRSSALVPSSSATIEFRSLDDAYYCHVYFYKNGGVDVGEDAKLMICKNEIPDRYIPPLTAVDLVARKTTEQLNEKVNVEGIQEVVTENLADIKSNVLKWSKTVTVKGTGNYAFLDYCTYDDPIQIGDVFKLTVDNVEGATATPPYSILVANGSTEIRHGNDLITIKDSDLVAGVNRIIFRLYPAKGTALPTGEATFTDVKCLKGNQVVNTLTGTLRQAVIEAAENRYDIPPYYTDEYLTSKVNQIDSLANESAGNGDVFFFITDEHWVYNQKHSPALIGYFASKCNIPRLFSGGDTADHGSAAFCDDIRTNFKHDIHHLCGNHEWMNPTTGDVLCYMMDMFSSNQIGKPEKHYYYVDNPQKKIRYIILNSYESNSDSAVIAAQSGYNRQQLTWFTSDALNLPSLDWDAIVFTHYIGTYSTTSISGYRDFLSAIDAFNADTNHSGKILCIFEGHTHYDAVWHTDGGTPIIVVTCDKNEPWISSGVNREPWLSEYRQSGTINEQAFEIVIIDRNSQAINLVRIGCPAYDNVDITPNDTNFSYIPTLEVRTVNY